MTVKLNLNESGSPLNPSIKIKRIPGIRKYPSRVKDSIWSYESKPWGVYPWGSSMHGSIESHYFYRIGRDLPDGDIINLGVGRGSSVFSFCIGMKEANKKNKVYGVDLYNHCPGMTKSFLLDTYKKLEVIDYVKLYEGYTHEVVHELKHKEFSFLFIDADHHYETCKSDFELWSPLVIKEGFVSFHDVSLNTVDRVIKEMGSEWELVDQIFETKTFKRK